MEESKGLSELCTAKLVTQSNKILDASPKNQLTNWVYMLRLIMVSPYQIQWKCFCDC